MNADLELIRQLGATPDFDTDERCLLCSADLDPLALELAAADSTVTSCPRCGVVLAA